MTAKKCLTVFYNVEVNNDVSSISNDEVDGQEGEKQENSYEEDVRRVYMLGEKNSGFTSRGPSQNYSKLLQECLDTKKLFEDENFAPDTITLPKDVKTIKWKRPQEIVTNPEFFIEDATRFDVNQGQIGDCWVLAAIANLTTNKQLFQFVVPEGQSFTQNYAGIFHFRFWHYGRWVDVVIDDRLPTIKNKPAFLKSSNPNEFWTSLLEKAYAKFYGSYEQIVGGQISEALEDMTGGLSEVYEAGHPMLSEIILKSYERSSFMGCSITSKEVEGRRPDGLVTMHAYSITKVVPLTSDAAPTRLLLRIRNPWGDDVEWKGAWSDNSDRWLKVSEETRKQLLVKEFDGEFWMEIGDFQKKFSYLDICHVRPDAFFLESDARKRWHFKKFEGAWVANITSGGGIENLETIHHNPQYFFTIKRNSKIRSVVVGLMQKERRELVVPNLLIELLIYAAPTRESKLLERQFFEKNSPLLRERSYSRQITGRLHLGPGRYCIIPCTAKPNLSGQYLLRVFSEIDHNLLESGNEIEYSGIDAAAHQGASEIVGKTFRKSFRKIAGKEGAVGWQKVRKILNKNYSNPPAFCFSKAKKVFTNETCQSIVALWDQNYTGKLDYNEFWKLMTDVATLEIIFKRFDRDRSGNLNGFELRNLLATCGYKVNSQILNVIMLRYGANGTMSFQNFVVCIFKMKTMIDEFHGKTTVEGRDAIIINKKDWLQTTLYR